VYRGPPAGTSALEEGLKVARRRWVGVLLNHEARGSVLNVYGAEPLVNATRVHDAVDIASNFVQAAAANDDVQSLDRHRAPTS